METEGKSDGTGLRQQEISSPSRLGTSTSQPDLHEYMAEAFEITSVPSTPQFLGKTSGEIWITDAKPTVV